MPVHTVEDFSTDPNTKCESIEQSEIVLKTENEGGRRQGDRRQEEI